MQQKVSFPTQPTTSATPRVIHPMVTRQRLRNNPSLCQEMALLTSTNLLSEYKTFKKASQDP